MLEGREFAPLRIGEGVRMREGGDAQTKRKGTHDFSSGAAGNTSQKVSRKKSMSDIRASNVKSSKT